MGFIRVKKVKGNEYFYYCERRRLRIKDGGNGKVITIEKPLGKSLFSFPYLPYWLWNGLTVQDFIEAYCQFRLKQFGYNKGIRFDIQWKLKKGKPIKGKLIFRSIPGSYVDARKAYPRYLRRAIQEIINEAIACQDYRNREIDRLAYYLAEHQWCKRHLTELEAKYKKWRKDPDRRWEENGKLYRYSDTYGDDCLEAIDNAREGISFYLEWHLELLDDLVKSAPTSEQEKFKSAIIQRAEKLSERPNFIDWYQATYPD